jgi:hypothetical protein
MSNWNINCVSISTHHCTSKMDTVKTYFGKRADLRVNIDDFLSIQLKILKLTSFYSDENILFFWLITFVAVLISSLLVVTTYLSFNSYENFIINGMFATSFITAWFKSYQFRRQYKPIAMLLETLKHPAFQPRSDSQRRALKDVNRQLFLLFFYWVILTILLFASWLLTTLGTSSQRLMFDMWLPFDYTSHPCYEIVYLLQFFYLIVDASLLISTDLVVLNFMAIIGVECAMIGDTLRNIYTITEEELVENNLVVLKTDVYKRMDTTLRSCIQQYQHVLE